MVNHPSFEREDLKVQREKKSIIKGKFAQDHDQKLNHKKDLTVGNKIMNMRIDCESRAE
jgi:hypothetical protein